MQLKLFRHLWGVTQPWEEALPKIKAEGFAGIETGLPSGDNEPRLASLLKEHAFDYIAMVFTSGKTVDEHLESFRRGLDHAKRFGAVQVTCHSGADSWSADEADAFYKQAASAEREVGVVVGHETHRIRAFFSPWATRDILRRHEAIKLCCDLSHWCCVSERLTWDTGGILDLCAQRCVHVHARVGYAEGPQVPDPSAAEYANEVEQHLKWWEAIWAGQRKRGQQVSTVTPEFGPPGYLHTLPHTNVPVADLWRVCKWMADRVRERYGAAS